MPLVRIDVQQGRTPAELRKIADVVQGVMLDVFAAPPGDRYQIITEHPVGQIIAEDTGLGFERTDGVVVIQIVQQGRTPNRRRPRTSSWPSDWRPCGVRPDRPDRLGGGERAATTGPSGWAAPSSWRATWPDREKFPRAEAATHFPYTHLTQR